jgi:two-component system NtrC family sensor kinase
MGQISAGVAHEINNPLSTILLYSHMLLKAHREGDAESEDIQMIVSEANRCRTIMRGLLDFARQTRVVKAPSDLRALIGEVAQAANLRLREAGPRLAGAVVRVRAEVSAGLPWLLLDSQQIRQMLVNLVQNGIDAVEGRPGAGAPAGAPVSAGSPGEVVVSAALSAKGDTVHLRVSDNGCGMPPDVIKEIFTPFYTTKELGKGTGMGLSIVYGVVKMHAGDISVESDPGKGTTFLVRLPAECLPAREEPHGRVTNRAAC